MKEALIRDLGTEIESISHAIESAFDVLGPVSKQKLFSQLKDEYGLEIWSATISDLYEIKNAIVDLFGETAASLIMKLIYREMENVNC